MHLLLVMFQLEMIRSKFPDKHFQALPKHSPVIPVVSRGRNKTGGGDQVSKHKLSFSHPTDDSMWNCVCVCLCVNMKECVWYLFGEWWDVLLLFAPELLMSERCIPCECFRLKCDTYWLILNSWTHKQHASIIHPFHSYFIKHSVNGIQTSPIS